MCLERPCAAPCDWVYADDFWGTVGTEWNGWMSRRFQELRDELAELAGHDQDMDPHELEVDVRMQCECPGGGNVTSIGPGGVTVQPGFCEYKNLGKEITFIRLTTLGGDDDPCESADPPDECEDVLIGEELCGDTPFNPCTEELLDDGQTIDDTTDAFEELACDDDDPNCDDETEESVTVGEPDCTGTDCEETDEGEPCGEGTSDVDCDGTPDEDGGDDEEEES